MNNFVVGTYVRHTAFPQYGTGRVKYVHPNGSSLAVEFENATGLQHNCAGHCLFNHARWSKAKSLDIVQPFKVGDKVQIAATPTDPWCYADGYNGKIGMVIRIGLGTPDVKVEGFNYSQYVPAHDLTLVKEEPVEAVKAATPKIKLRTFKKGSQVERILKFLLTGEKLTPLKARQLFGAERLAARILELRQAGHKVVATTKTDLNGKVYGEYSLRKIDRFGKKVAA